MTYKAGRLNGVWPEPGTIMGPNVWGEYVVAIEHDERGTVFGLATVDAMKAMLDRLETEAPRSLVEVQHQRAAFVRGQIRKWLETQKTGVEK